MSTAKPWTPDVVVNLNPEYIGVPIPIGLIPTIVAVVPLFYHLPTLFVIIKVFAVYLETKSGKRDSVINPHVMFVIVIHQFTTFFYVISDYLNVRIPATGIMTEWCASQEPSHFLKILFWMPIYSYYLAMLFPFLIAILRLVPIFYPANYEKKSELITKFSIPSIFLYPFLFSWFNYPGLGVCRPYPPPYSFGAIYVHCINMWRGLKNVPFLMINSTVWLVASVVANIVLYRRLRKLGNRGKSARLQRAEHSLTLTTITLMVTYFTNFLFMVVFGLFPGNAQYFAVLRSTGSDLEAVMVPWIFFLVHPAFKNNKFFFMKRGVRRSIISVKVAST